MTTESVSPDADISFRSNRMLVNGDFLRLDEVSPEEFRAILAMARTAIVEYIEDFYAQTTAANPGATVVRAGIDVVRLSPNDDRLDVVSHYGALNNTNILRHIIEIERGPARELWKAVADNDLVPEARLLTRNPQDGDNVVLRVHNPEHEPHLPPLAHLPRALGYVTPAASLELVPQMHDAWRDNNVEAYSQLLAQYDDNGDEWIEQLRSAYGDSRADKATLGRAIELMNIRYRIEGYLFIMKSSSNDYKWMLGRVHLSAWGEHLTEIAEVIQEEIDRVSDLHHLS